MALDPSFLKRKIAEIEALQSPTESPQPSLGGGGDGPYDPGMEARITALDERVGRIENRIDGMDTRLRGVEVKLGEVSGKLDVIVTQMASMDARLGQMINKLPSWWQMPAVIGATVALLILLYSLAEYAHAWGRL